MPSLPSTVERAYREIDAHNEGRGLWYVMTPYTRYTEGRTKAFVHACRVTASLGASSLLVFSPIVHFHPLQQIAQGSFDGDTDFWLSRNKPFLDASVGAILAELPGWQDSAGIASEVDYLLKANKPVVHLPVPNDMTAY